MIKDILMFILMFISSYFIVSIVHELGHVISGLYYGFKLSCLIIGPLGIKRDENDKLKLYIEKNLAFWGGIGGTTPTKKNNASINIISNILIAGPIIQLLFGLICLFVCLYYLNLFFYLLGFMAIGASISSIIPFPQRIGGFYTDGARWLKIKKSKKNGLVELSCFNIVQSYYKYKNYSKINTLDINCLIKNEEPSNQYLGHYFLMLYYKDSGDIVNMSKEKEILKNLESKVTKSFIKIYNYKEC